MRTDFPLGPASVVFDVGAYDGWWSETLKDRYGCRIYAFEPEPINFVSCMQRLATGELYPFGLGSHTRQQQISLMDDASSFLVGKPETMCEIQSISEVMKALKIEFVDLMKVNIEGMEYELLPYLVETGEIRKFGSIFVQFHNFLPEWVVERANCIEGIKKTHDLSSDTPDWTFFQTRGKRS